MKCPDDLDISVVVENLDPDWRDHFLTIDDAFLHYWSYMNSNEKRDAVNEAMQ